MAWSPCKHQASVAAARVFLLALAVFVTGSLSSAGEATEPEADAVSHPYLIVTEAQYPALRQRAQQSPWKEMMANAIRDCNAAQVNITSDTQSNADQMRKAASSCALAYILDPGQKSQYLARAVDAFQKWDQIHARRISYEWKYVVPTGSAFFNTVLALDVMFNDISSATRAEIEADLRPVADWYKTPDASWWPPNHDGVVGIWAMYWGDREEIDRWKASYKSDLLTQFTPDGVFREGPGYASARFAGVRDAKRHFLDVLEFTGEDRSYYSNPKLQNFFEWFYGYSMTPFDTDVGFGDTAALSHSTYIYHTASIFSASRFSPRAARLAAWRWDGKAPGELLSYVLYDQPLPAPEEPASAIFPDGGAFFLKDSPTRTSLVASLWNAKSSGWHSHFDVNAIYMAGYGEVLLTNSGYLGASKGALGFSWDYVNKNAESGNTITIEGANHVQKSGGGITEGFTTSMIDYASGSSGNALPNGTHQRNLVFVHPQEGHGGYVILFDEVQAGQPGMRANLVLHPNAEQVTVVSPAEEYLARIGPIRFTSDDVSLILFLGTPPRSAELRNGLIADWVNSFVGRYLYASFDTDPEGKRNIVSVLYPHTPAHPPPAIERISSPGVTGARLRFSSGVTDVALESGGSEVHGLEGISFQASSVLYRMNENSLAFYFVRKAKSFEFEEPAAMGFVAQDEVSLFMRQGRGVIYSPDTDVTFYDPRVNNVILDGAPQPALDRGAGWIRVAVPPGLHQIELVLTADTAVFADVPFDHPFHDVIEILYQNGYTAGCSTDPLMYCPDNTMNRAESAVFVERGIHGTTGVPPQPSTQVFADLPLDSWAAKWAHALWEDHYTAGCGTDPLIYCPWQGHTRAEGCVFFLHMLNGPDFIPTQPSQQTFADVPLDTWYAKWVQATHEAGLTTPCQTSPALRYCPDDPLTRAVAAAMMVRAKGLGTP